MKDIKERVRDKNPKIRNPAARLPKELVRHTGTGGYFVTGYLYGKRKNNDHEYDKL